MPHINVRRTIYSIVGLGKLGASMAAAIARRGFDVIGVDVNASVIEAVNAGRAPVSETGLADAIETNRARLSATAYHSEATARSDVTFVVVPTPSDRTGMFSLQYASYAFREIGRGLAKRRPDRLIAGIPRHAKNIIGCLHRCSLECAASGLGHPRLQVAGLKHRIAMVAVQRDQPVAPT